MGVLGVNHLACSTRDPDLLRRFYIELTGGEELEGEHRPILLGQTRRLEFTHDDRGVYWRE